MSATAKYKLSMTSPTSSAQQSGTITPEQYGAACAVLNSPKDAALFHVAGDLLAALEHLVQNADEIEHDSYALQDAIARAKELIAEAKGE